MVLKISGTITRIEEDGVLYEAGGIGGLELYVNGVRWGKPTGQAETRFVNTTALNIRATPWGAILAQARFENQLTVWLSSKQSTSDQLEWVKVRFGQVDGWAALKYLSPLPPSTGGGSSPVDPAQPFQIVTEASGKKTYRFPDRPPKSQYIWLNWRPGFYLGTPQFPHTNRGDIIRMVDEAKAAGVGGFRFWLPADKLSPAQCASYAKEVLDLLHNRGMYAIVTLNDSLSHSSLYVRGNEQYRTGRSGELNRRFFYDTGAWIHPHNFIRAALPPIANHPAIFAWEVGNELAPHSEDPTRPTQISEADSKAVWNYMKGTINIIRSLSVKQVALGCVDFGNITPHGTKADALNFIKGLGLSYVDPHWYDHDGNQWRLEQTVAAAREAKLPVILGETGILQKGQNRLPQYRQMFDGFAWFCAVNCVWGYDKGQGLSDDKGLHDRYFDYPAILSEIRSRNL